MDAAALAAAAAAGVTVDGAHKGVPQRACAVGRISSIGLSTSFFVFLLVDVTIRPHRAPKAEAAQRKVCEPAFRCFFHRSNVPLLEATRAFAFLSSAAGAYAACRSAGSAATRQRHPTESSLAELPQRVLSSRRVLRRRVRLRGRLHWQRLLTGLLRRGQYVLDARLVPRLCMQVRQRVDRLRLQSAAMPQ